MYFDNEYSLSQLFNIFIFRAFAFLRSGGHFNPVGCDFKLVSIWGWGVGGSIFSYFFFEINIKWCLDIH